MGWKLDGNGVRRYAFRKSMTFVRRYVDYLYRGRWLVVAAWLALIVVSLVGGALDFSNRSNNLVVPSPGGPGYEIFHTYNRLFPTLSSQTSYAIVVKCSKCSDVASDLSVKAFILGIQTDLMMWAQKHHACKMILSVESYFSFANNSLTQPISKGFVTDDKKATLMILQLNSAFSQSVRFEYYSHLKSELKRFQNQKASRESGIFAGVTGTDAFNSDISQSLLGNVIRADMVCIPISLAILCYMIESWRLLILSLINLGLSMMVSFYMMLLISERIGYPNSVTAQFMQTILLALTIDYSLFLFTRFRQVVKLKGETNRFEAVTDVLRNSGHVILMSGSIIIFAFCGLAYMQTTNILQMGLGSSMSIFFCMLVNLTLTPALLLIGFPFFNSFIDLSSSRFKRCFQSHKNEKEEVEPLLAHERDVEERGEPTDTSENQPIGEQHGCWFRLSQRLVTFPTNIGVIVLLYALSVPFTYYASQFRALNDVMLSVDDSLPAAKALHVLTHTFGPGFTSDFAVMVYRENNHTILDSDYFNYMAALTVHLESDVRINTSIVNVQSVARINGTNVTAQMASALLRSPSQYGALYSYVWDKHTNVMNTSSLISIMVKFNPSGSESGVFTKRLQSSVAAFRRHGFLTAAVGAKVFESDVTDYAISHFIRMVIMIIGIIVVLVGFMFRSISIPFRLLLTLAVPLASVFGLAVLVFQKGILSWFGSKMLQPVAGFYWVVPIISVCVCVGLALDYDIFLMARIVEYRFNGYTNKASIIKAVEETGNIITAAGCIMAVAFSSLLFQKQPTMFQTGWIFVTSILLDTFIVRTILVPSIMSLGSDYVWWPRRPPTAKLKNEYGEIVVE